MPWCVRQRLLPDPLGRSLLRPLAFTVQAHAISSTASAEDAFGAITSDPTFREGDFYAFVFEFSGRCVAHGYDSDFVGMTLRDIMGTLNMPDSILSGAAETHQRFKAAAEAGGGWVEYEWANLNAPGQPTFQKVAYIFSLHRDGIEYYGGAHRTLLRFAVWQLRHLSTI